MLRGLYIGTTGMMARMSQLDIIANNLANISTPGYKKDKMTFKPFPSMFLSRLYDEYRMIAGELVDQRPPVGRMPTGVGADGIYTYHTQGILKKTNNPFDLAIQGEGYFAVEAPGGETYTRDGSFTLNEEGYLVTKNGYYVLGEAGPIKIDDPNFYVRKDGTIIANAEPGATDWKEPQIIDRLKIVRFEKPKGLRKLGGNLFRPTTLSGPPLMAERFQIHQGFLEQSNVNPVQEMVDMIRISRMYELNQKVVSSFDETLRMGITRVGRPR
jgi:flagellar basal-body rod protein FlgG